MCKPKSCYMLQIGPYAVPKGTPFHISVYAMHHDERWWQEAAAFKPERWIGDKTGGDRSGGLAYLPFGAGPRMCIGIKLAGKMLRSHCHYVWAIAVPKRKPQP